MATVLGHRDPGPSPKIIAVLGQIDPNSAKIDFQKPFQIILLTEMPSMRENGDGLVGASDQGLHWTKLAVLPSLASDRQAARQGLTCLQALCKA
jgi:hypothetical protein